MWIMSLYLYFTPYVFFVSLFMCVYIRSFMFLHALIYIDPHTWMCSLTWNCTFKSYRGSIQVSSIGSPFPDIYHIPTFAQMRFLMSVSVPVCACARVWTSEFSLLLWLTVGLSPCNAKLFQLLWLNNK